MFIKILDILDNRYLNFPPEIAHGELHCLLSFLAVVQHLISEEQKHLLHTNARTTFKLARDITADLFQSLHQWE